jgi:hypothetical protein
MRKSYISKASLASAMLKECVRWLERGCGDPGRAREVEINAVNNILGKLKRRILARDLRSSFCVTVTTAAAEKEKELRETLKY